MILKEHFRIAQKIAKDYGPIASVWMKSDFNVLLSDPKDIEVRILETFIGHQLDNN